MLALNVRLAAEENMAACGQASSENAKYHKRYGRAARRQVPKLARKNLKLSAITCRNGRILTVKCQTTLAAATVAVFADRKLTTIPADRQ